MDRTITLTITMRGFTEEQLEELPLGEGIKQELMNDLAQVCELPAGANIDVKVDNEFDE